MIENPKVGQRVWWLDISDGYCELIEGVVVVLDPIDAPLIWVREERLGGDEHEIWRERLYDSPQSAAAALRNQAQELLLVAARLEQETPNDD